MSTTPVVAATRVELAAVLRDARAADRRVALVPTMGALHGGHASLLRTARERLGSDGLVVVSVFVNPLQFGVGEDLDRYPRTFAEDLAVCGREGADVVFAPTVDEMYPAGDPQVTVKPGPLGKVLEGKTRPGHFRGVLTVVAKLFGLVRPDIAVFGQKDYQQLVLIRRMVTDLDMGIEVVGAETVREPDGLALSSRNRYLGTEERNAAVALSRALRAAQENAEYGLEVAVREARTELREHLVDLDYLTVTGPDLETLPAVVPPGTPARILVAARVGTTRLIDNLPLVLGRPTDTQGES